MTFGEFFRIMNTIGIGEMSFSVKNHENYKHCWLGVAIKHYELIFWLGLAEDDRGYFEFKSLDVMINATVFNGSSLKELWNDIEIGSIDGVCEEDYTPEECSFNYYNYLEEQGEVLVTIKPSSWNLLKYILKVIIWIPLVFAISGVLLALFDEFT